MKIPVNFTEILNEQLPTAAQIAQFEAERKAWLDDYFARKRGDAVPDMFIQPEPVSSYP